MSRIWPLKTHQTRHYGALLGKRDGMKMFALFRATYRHLYTHTHMCITLTSRRRQVWEMESVWYTQIQAVRMLWTAGPCSKILTKCVFLQLLFVFREHVTQLRVSPKFRLPTLAKHGGYYSHTYSHHYSNATCTINDCSITFIC